MSTRVTKHASPALLERGVRGVAAEPLEIVLHLPTAPALSVTGFAKNSAFPEPVLLGSVRELVRSAFQRPDARLVLFGHADADGSERNEKVLSDRRAQVVLALVTQDVQQFDQAAQDESWGDAQYGSMLSALGLDLPGAGSGHDRSDETRAVRGFQQGYNQGAFHSGRSRERAHGQLRVDGKLGPRTEAALRDAYLASLGASLEAKRFIGPQAVGCSAFNRSGAARRVSLAFYGRDFPTESKINAKARHPSKCNSIGVLSTRSQMPSVSPRRAPSKQHFSAFMSA